MSTRTFTITGISLALIAAVLVIILLSTKPDGGPARTPTSADTTPSAVWHEAVVERLVESPTGMAASVKDVYAATLTDTSSGKRYVLYYDGPVDEAPLPLGLFVVSNTVQIQESGTDDGHVCAIAYGGYSLLTGESGC